jgi:hypothetical protein
MIKYVLLGFYLLHEPNFVLFGNFDSLQECEKQVVHAQQELQQITGQYKDSNSVCLSNRLCYAANRVYNEFVGCFPKDKMAGIYEYRSPSGFSHYPPLNLKVAQ